MNRYKFILSIFTLFFMSLNPAFCANLDSIIKNSEINNNATIAVSVKDTKSGRTVYEYNENKLVNPASVQKIFTMKAAYDELKPEYTFDTKAYIDTNNNLYIKLSADPSLSTAKLKNLLITSKEIHKKSFNDIIIDDSIIDNKQWGTGWMWDDDVNQLLPKYSPYTINQNKISVKITPGKNGRLPEIKNNSNYHMIFVNLLKNGEANNIIFERMPWLSSDMTYVKGSIKTETTMKLPVDSPQSYFMNELRKAISGAGLKYSGQIKTAPVPQKAKLIATESSENLDKLIAETLKSSNNLYSELIFKVAGAHYSQKQGNTDNAIELFQKQYSDLNESKDIAIVDACGISRNNLISANWTTSALNKIYKTPEFEQFAILLPKPMEGTLSNRLLDISLRLRAKTGTASGISSIAGYIDTKSNKKYSFAIFVQNHNTDTDKVKKLEDDIIMEIYKM